jgi:hypothetical protein
VTSNDFRRMALSFPETTENEHMGHPDFRVRGKIFATLGYGGAECGMVKLTPEQQAEWVANEPANFVPVKGAWGRRGATQVRLGSANRTAVHAALTMAWLNTAPRKLVEEFEASR